MTITNSNSRIAYTGNGVTVAFSFPYAFDSQDDLVVILKVTTTGVETVQTITTHYTISGTVDSLGRYPTGGTITFVTAPPSTVSATIYRDPEALQDLDLPGNGLLPSEPLEAELDYLTMLAQRTRDIADRSLRLSEGEASTDAKTILPFDRASKYFAFNSSKEPIAIDASTASGTTVTAAGSTAARLLADRFADVFNVLDYGAVRDGVTDDATAIQATYDAADASGAPATVFFPSGNYLKSTVTTIYGNNITTFAYGAVVDCDGADGFILDIVDQDNHQFLGMEIYNFLTVGYGIPTSGGANSTLKRWFTVRDCVIRDSVQTNVNVRGIQLSCETYGVKILDNHLSNITTTSTSTGGNSYGIIVGKKADSLAGGRTGELGSYGYNNSDIHTAEGSTIISGNTIRKMRCSGGLTTDSITGILADGWRCIVSNNVIEDVQYIGAGVFGASGVGIYSRGREHVITGNSIANCSYACILIKDTGASVTWGDNATTNVTNNVIATLCPLVNSEGYAYSGINNLGNGTNISDNKFVRWKGGIQSSAIFSAPGAAIAHRVRIANNTFDRCGFFYGIRATGSAATITGNQFYYPIGTVSGSMTTINYSAVSAAHSVQIQDNTLHIDTTFVGTGSVPTLVLIQCNTFAIIGLKIKNNSARGWLGGGPTVGIWDLISCTIDSATCSDWDISGNSTDALFRGIGAGSEQLRKYTAFNFSGAGVSPTILRKTFDFTTEIILTAASTLTLIEDESGATFANVGAVAAWFYVLPVSLAGMEFGFRKVVAQAMTVDPNGSEIINAGTAGGILTLTNVGSCVYLKCFVAGTWVVTNSNGAYTVA